MIYTWKTDNYIEAVNVARNIYIYTSDMIPSTFCYQFPIAETQS